MPSATCDLIIVPVVIDVDRATSTPALATWWPNVVMVLLVINSGTTVFDALTSDSLTPVMVELNVVAFAKTIVLLLVPMVTTFEPESPMVIPAPAPFTVADATERNAAAPALLTLQLLLVPVMSFPDPLCASEISAPDVLDALKVSTLLLVPEVS